jgi:membrane protease subunit HflC
MIASYDKQALSIRSEGDAQKIRIESEAKRQAEEIRAKARKEAEIMRGDADSERNKIFAVAYEKDPEFFKFYRSLMAYQKTFAEQGNTSFVLSPSSEFLKYMNSNKANE